MVEPDGLGAHACVAGELANGDHYPIVAHLTFPLGQRCTISGMTSSSPDRETLRALADDGNEKALDRLADLADGRGDLDELSELLDEGCARAGQLLTRRAVTNNDLLELQRLSDAGAGEASVELDRLLNGGPA